MNSKSFLFLALTVLAGNLAVHAQSTAFTYQGRLDSSGSPSTGSYDLRVFVFDAAGGGFLRGFLTNSAVVVSNGLFTTTLDFGFGVFNGGPRWLEIGVRSNGTATAFNTLAPRQAVLPAPYAITAGNLSGALSSANLSGIYSGQVSFNNGGNAFFGSGANLNGLNASQLTSGTVPAPALGNAWGITGNAGTTPGTQFLGTTDNQPLEFKVNNQRALRIEPTFSGLPNIIWGSAANTVEGGVQAATIAGGNRNTIRGNASYSTIGGGETNTVEGGVQAATIAGGNRNTIRGNASYSTIGGGVFNTIGLNSFYATIGGGDHNNIGSNSLSATIAGGDFNNIGSNSLSATIAGGQGNAIGWNSSYATIAGGYGNNIGLNSSYATIAGGHGNTTGWNSRFATIAGGYNNFATNLAFAAGTQARAIHTGAFVWADSRPLDFVSTASDQFNIRAQGGVRLNNDTSMSFGNQTRQMLNLYGIKYGIGVQASSLYFRSDSASATDGFIWYKGGIHSDGYAQPGAGGTELMHLVQGALYVNGTFVSSSDRNVKENFKPVDTRAVLDKVAALPVSEWNYKADTASRHIGPMAQDFYAAFGVGPDDKHITTVDEGGVALAAIKGLNEKVESGTQRSETRMERLETENAELKARLEKLERMLQHTLDGVAK